MRFLSLVSLALVSVCGLQAQTAETPQASAATLSVAAKLVNVPVVVRDKKGALIQTLGKDDFVLAVDGKAQVIRYFDQDKDIPLILGLMVDTSMSQRKVLDEERTASTTFLEQMLTGPKDKAFVIQFAAQTDLLQDLTSSKPKLQAALKQIDSANTSSGQGSNDPNNTNGPDRSSDPDARQQGGGGGRRGRGGMGRGGAGTTLYDALFLASDEITGKQKGRKAVVILSDGVDRGSKESLTKSMEAAQRADTIVYAIYFKGEDHGGGFGGDRGGGFGFPGGGGRGGMGGGRGGGGGQRGGGEREVDGKKILERMANETGGRLFEISKKQTVEQIYTQIGQELRAQYRLGFTPDSETAQEGYHEVALTLKDAEKKKLTVQTRDGYYTGN